MAAASCAALVVGSAAVATLLGPWARGRSAGWLSDNISSNIAGEIRIDEVESWSMTGLTLRQVQLLDTQGRTVINLPTLRTR